MVLPCIVFAHLKQLKLFSHSDDSLYPLDPSSWHFSKIYLKKERHILKVSYGIYELRKLHKKVSNYTLQDFFLHFQRKVLNTDMKTLALWPWPSSVNLIHHPDLFQIINLCFAQICGEYPPACACPQVMWLQNAFSWWCTEEWKKWKGWAVLLVPPAFLCGICLDCSFWMV